MAAFGDRSDYLPRGKVLGGSSSVNAMIFQRGHPANYDGWVALGNDADFVAPTLMLAELRSDNERLVGFMRDAHFVCGGFDDVASMGLLENWIDDAERRVWFLFECGRKG